MRRIIRVANNATRTYERRQEVPSILPQFNPPSDTLTTCLITSNHSLAPMKNYLIPSNPIPLQQYLSRSFKVKNIKCRAVEIGKNVLFKRGKQKTRYLLEKIFKETKYLEKLEINNDNFYKQIELKGLSRAIPRLRHLQIKAEEIFDTPFRY